MRCKFQSKGVDFHQVPGLCGWTGVGVSSIKQTFHVETLTQTLKAIVFILTLWELSVNFLLFSHMEYSCKAKILWLNLLEKYKIKSYRTILCSQFRNSINFLYNPDLMTFPFAFWKAAITPPLPG